MNIPPPPDGPVYSLKIRKAIRLVVMIPILVVLIIMILHHKGFINLEEILGIPENYLYFGFLGVALLGIPAALLVWRCPGCGAWLGKKANPVCCNSCGAEFR
jgi:hypothetical protein